MYVFCNVCIEIAEQVILANKKSIYDTCLSNKDFNFLKIMIDALTKYSSINYMNNNIDFKNFAWILSRIILHNYHDSSKFQYMEHIIVSGVFSENYLICILSMDIWLLFANELPAAERINYVHICKKINQNTYNSSNLSKSLCKILIINLFNMLDSDSQIKVNTNNSLQSWLNEKSTMRTTLENMFLNQTTKDNYYKLIQVMQSLEFCNSFSDQYVEFLNMIIHYTVKINIRKFESLIICIFKNIKNLKDIQLLNKFKISINKKKKSSVIQLICLIDLFHNYKVANKTLIYNEIELLLNDNELLVRLIAYKSLELPNRSVIMKTEFENYTQHVSNIQIKRSNHCITHRYKSNDSELSHSNEKLIDKVLYNILKFSKILQEVPQKQITTKHKIKIVKISENFNSLN